jgi:hypothetical protein
MNEPVVPRASAVVIWCLDLLIKAAFISFFHILFSVIRLSVLTPLFVSAHGCVVEE